MTIQRILDATEREKVRKISNSYRKTIHKVNGRDWHNFLNSQKYQECQVVTAINAYYYLTGKQIKQHYQRYEKLVDLVCSRYGSAINIEKVHRRLGLKTKKHEWLFGIDKKMLPLGMNIWHKAYGFHSVCVVDVCEKPNCIRVCNFKAGTNLEGWIFWEDFQHYRMKANWENKADAFTFKIDKKRR